MNTIRIILPALLTMIFSIGLIWLIAHYIKREIKDTDVTSIIVKVRNILSVLIIFANIWWITELLTVNEIPRSKQDRTLNNQMRDNFKERMMRDTSK